MAYRADIEIAVKGAQELKRLSDQISATSKLVDGLNNYLENIGTGGVVRNINNLNSAVYEAAAAFNKVALGTEEATIAARAYDQATRAANAGIEEKLRLLQAVREEERKSRLTAAGISERTQYGGQIGPGAASSVLGGQSAPVEERIRRTLQARKDETQLQQALLQLEQKSATELNRKLQSQEALVKGTREVLELLDQQVKKQQFLAGKTTGSVQGPLAGPGAMGFPVALPLSRAEQKGLEIEYQKQQIIQRTLKTKQDLQGLALNLQRLDQNSAVAIADAERNQRKLNAAKERELQISKQGALIAGRFSPIGGAENIPGSPAAIAAANRRNREATSNAIIGGAFPLLFGQGVGASVGGAAGGYAGGRIGGQMGFGLSLVGTALGASFDALSQSAVEFAKSMRQGGDAASYLENALGYLDPTIKKQIQNLQKSGQTAAAAELALKELSDIVGKEGAEAFLEFGKRTEASALSLKRIAASFLAAGIAANKYFSDLKYGKDKNFTDFLPQQFRPITIPAAAKETAEAKQKTAELAKGNEILRLQVQLTSLSAKNDLARFVTVQKQIANEEYKNELTKVAIQLKNKEISIEQNKLLITAANLELSKKLGDIERTRLTELNRRQEEAAKAAKEAADRADEVAKARLSVEKSLAEERLRLIDINVKEVESLNGEEAALRRSLMLSEKRAEQTSVVLSIERALAMKEAAKYGIAQQTALLYDRKLINAQHELNIENRITEQRLAQMQTMRAMQLYETTSAAVQPINDFLRNQELELQLAQKYQYLVREGVLPAEADRLVNFEKLIQAQLNSLDVQIEITKATILEAQKQGDVTTELENQFKLRNLIAGRTAVMSKALAGPGAGKLQTQRLNEAFGETRGELNKLLDPVNQIVSGAKTIGDAFGQAFQQIATGSASTQEALSQMFKNIGENFINMAAQIIAQQMTMIVLGGIMKALGVGISGGAQTANTGGFAGMTVPNNALGEAMTLQMMSFADGGFVTGPTQAVVGEGGEPEYIIPASKMSAAMQRYSAGARGSAVIPSSGATTEGDTSSVSGGTAVAGGIDVRFNVERINSVDYVTADQFQAGIRQAAQQGATQGEQRTLRRLQQSRSTRSRLGMA